MGPMSLVRNSKIIFATLLSTLSEMQGLIIIHKPLKDRCCPLLPNRFWAILCNSILQNFSPAAGIY